MPVTFYEILKFNHITGKFKVYQRDTVKETQETYNRIKKQKLAKGTSLRVSRCTSEEIEDIFAEVD
jgi:rRNA maturation endonuclease Nob1